MGSITVVYQRHGGIAFVRYRNAMSPKLKTQSCFPYNVVERNQDNHENHLKITVQTTAWRHMRRPGRSLQRLCNYYFGIRSRFGTALRKRDHSQSCFPYNVVERNQDNHKNHLKIIVQTTARHMRRQISDGKRVSAGQTGSL
jgi:hypothetical protein